MKSVVSRVVASSLYRLGYLWTNCRRGLVEVGRKSRDSAVANRFIEDGFVHMEGGQFAGMSDYLLPRLSTFTSSGKAPEDLDLKVLTVNPKGIQSIAVGLQSPFLFQYVFRKELYELVESYYGRPFYLRNNPTIEINYADEPHNDAQLFHCDWGLRQLTLMVNLTDLVETSTHMDYVIGSNRKYWFYHPVRSSEHFQRSIDKYLQKRPDSIRLTTGQRDSGFLFDAGNGFHRQVGGTGRIMLHVILVDNLVFSDWRKSWVPAKKPGEAYWFSEHNDRVRDMIARGEIPEAFYSLVLRRFGGGFGVPAIFN